MAKLCFWRLLWRDFSETGGFSELAEILFGKQTATTKMNAEKQQWLDDFEKRFERLGQDFGEFKCRLGNLECRFNELKRRLNDLKYCFNEMENRFDELKR